MPPISKEFLSWLQVPVLDESGCHYKPYEEVKFTSTTEADRPSMKVNKMSTKGLNATIGPGRHSDQPIVNAYPNRGKHNQVVQLPFAESVMCSMQTAREVVECSKPRVVYCKSK